MDLVSITFFFPGTPVQLRHDRIQLDHEDGAQMYVRFITRSGATISSVGIPYQIAMEKPENPN